MQTEEESYLNAPHSKLAHLGCAGLIVLAGISGSWGMISGDGPGWPQEHPNLTLLLFLGSLAAAYLLEHALSTAAMLALLLAAAICAGLALTNYFPPETEPAFIWQLLAGPAGYFGSVALALRLGSGRLYRWQFCGIFAAASLLLPGLVCLLTGASQVTTICALCIGITTTIVELSVFYGRDYFEITSDSRARSTVIGMVMLITVPIYKVLWILLCSCYRGGMALFRFSRWW